MNLPYEKKSIVHVLVLVVCIVLPEIDLFPRCMPIDHGSFVNQERQLETIEQIRKLSAPP